MQPNHITHLLSPFRFGNLTLKNRVVMGSMSRCRADPKTGVPTDLHAKYYSQRT
jgi:N-ethylmaleimide reductase